MFLHPFGQHGQPDQSQGQQQQPSGFTNQSQSQGVWVVGPCPPHNTSEPPPPPPPPTPPAQQIVTASEQRWTPKELAAEEANIPIPPPISRSSSSSSSNDKDDHIEPPDVALVRTSSSSKEASSFFTEPQGSSTYENTKLTDMPRAGQKKGDGTVESSHFEVNSKLKGSGVQHTAGYQYKMVDEEGKHGKAEQWFEKGDK